MSGGRQPWLQMSWFFCCKGALLPYIAKGYLGKVLKRAALAWSCSCWSWKEWLSLMKIILGSQTVLGGCYGCWMHSEIPSAQSSTGQACPEVPGGSCVCMRVYLFTYFYAWSADVSLCVSDSMVRSWWFELGMSSWLWEWNKDKLLHKGWLGPGYIHRDLPVRSPSARA